MSQTTETKKDEQFKSKFLQREHYCFKSQALVDLTTRYPKDFVDQSFAILNQVFFDWLQSEFADDRDRREAATYSVEILNALGEIVKGIPEETFDRFGKMATKEAREEANAIMDSLVK